jgi:hypothetical protein
MASLSRSLSALADVLKFIYLLYGGAPPVYRIFSYAKMEREDRPKDRGRYDRQKIPVSTQ